MLSGVTRGARPPAYLDKATCYRTQFSLRGGGRTLENASTDWWPSVFRDSDSRGCLVRAHFTSFPNSSQQQAAPLANSGMNHYSVAVIQVEYWPFCSWTHNPPLDVDPYYSSNTMTHHHSASLAKLVAFRFKKKKKMEASSQLNVKYCSLGYEWGCNSWQVSRSRTGRLLLALAASK